MAPSDTQAPSPALVAPGGWGPHGCRGCWVLFSEAASEQGQKIQRKIQLWPQISKNTFQYVSLLLLYRVFLQFKQQEKKKINTKAPLRGSIFLFVSPSPILPWRKGEKKDSNERKSFHFLVRCPGRGGGGRQERGPRRCPAPVPQPGAAEVSLRASRPGGEPSPSDLPELTGWR